MEVLSIGREGGQHTRQGLRLDFPSRRILKQHLLVENITKHLEKDKGMTNPRPDMTFGLECEEDSFTTSIPQHILDLLWIAPGIHHPFLILEGRSNSGSSATAENQARRGGAILVKASRALWAIIEGDISTLPDLSDQEAKGLVDTDNEEDAKRYLPHNITQGTARW